MRLISDILIDTVVQKSQDRKIIFLGKSKEVDYLHNYFLKINIESATQYVFDNKTIYNLGYQEIGSFFVIDTFEKELYKNNKVIYHSLGLIERKDFINVDELADFQPSDCIDINLGYYHKLDGFGYTEWTSTDYQYTIVLLGGSTTFPNLTLMSRCWSEILFSNYLKNKKIKVICAGHPAFDSSQELFLLERDLLNLNPDMIISFSGVNDVYEHGIYNVIDSGYPKASPQMYQVLNDFKKLIENKKQERLCNLPIFYGTKTKESSPTIWCNNQKKMMQIANNANIKFVSILQPMIYSGNYTLNIDEKIAMKNIVKTYPDFTNLSVWMQNFCNTVKSIMKTESFFYDFTNIFDNFNGLYYDTCHVYEKGNQIIAENVYNKIVSKFLLKKM